MTDQIEIQNDDEDQQLYTEIYSWGSNDEGQMGLGENKRNTIFYYPRICSFQIIIHQISCGLDHTAFVAKNGYLYTIGSNALGKLGLGQTNVMNSFQPQLVTALQKYKVMQVSCGHSHTCAIIDSGELFSWGDSSEGQLGLNSNSSFYLPQLVSFNEQQDLQSTFVIDISCGYYHTGVVLKHGQVCTFGSGKKGQLGLGNNVNKSYKPELIHQLSKIIKINCGHYHTLFLDESGRVYSTGLNDEGQLGLGHNNNEYQPNIITQLEEYFVNKIIAGSHSAVITDQNDVYFFGKSNLGEFIQPQLVKIGASSVKDICIGNKFGIALTSVGKIYTWGINDQGQLGQGDHDNRIIPCLVESLFEKRVTQIACGNNYAICLGNLCDGKQKSFHKSYSQKSLIKQQLSPFNLGQEQTPQKQLIKSQSQLILAQKQNLIEEMSKKNNKNQQQDNEMYQTNGYNRNKSSKSVHSPSQQQVSEIYCNGFNEKPSQIDLNKSKKQQLLQSSQQQIKNNKIQQSQQQQQDQIPIQNIQEKQQNCAPFQTSQKNKNQCDSIGELSTREGIKLSSHQFDLVQDFQKSQASPNQSQSKRKMQQDYNEQIQHQFSQERQTYEDKIYNLENTLMKKNEFIVKLQKELQDIKANNNSKSPLKSDQLTQRESTLKKENCNLILENAKLNEENQQLLNVLQQQADQINELMQDNRELNVKLSQQNQEHEVQNKIVNQKLVNYAEKIVDLENIYSEYNSMKNEVKIKEERIKILEEQQIFLNRQIEKQIKNNGLSINYNNDLKESNVNVNNYSSNLNKHKNSLSIDIANYNSSNHQEPVSFRKGDQNSSFISNTNKNNNNNINNDKILKNILTPNSNNSMTNSNFYKPINYSEYNSVHSKIRSPYKYQLDNNSQIYSSQQQQLQKSILKNSQIENRIQQQNDYHRKMDEQIKHNVSFTDLDSSSYLPQSSSRILLDRRDQIKQENKNKSYSLHSQNQSNLQNLQNERNHSQLQLNLDNSNNNLYNMRSLENNNNISQNQYYSQKSNNSYIPQTTSHSQMNKQLDFLSYSKQQQSYTPSSHNEIEFSKQLNRTRSQLENRLNELNKKLLFKNQQY